ncbi:CoA transferase [Mycobacterium sp. MYCO198283]|uniref:CaiB/BaiF CoA transferase family protein n=1 Tax=Mycobacterium sp. MYCO198283 TaxID=2883505 RepID=UPI001E3C7FE2|nr:CoA transferase [Mycobacterium sp. MYCO198283]MCG5432921.1 CoA transferase [Mycobacterium sp. MYCO198283]
MSALTGFRVVELAETVAGEYCGKLLADFGADVVKVERPGAGTPTRALHPAAVFEFCNTNKRSVALDVAADPDALHRLIADADAVVDDHLGDWLARVGLSAADAASRHPDLVVCSITPHGAADRRTAHSLNVFHSSGWGYHTPSHADPAVPPLKGPGRFLADYEAGLDAALTVAACLFGRLHTGRGEFVDLSAQAVLVSRADCILGRFITGEVEPDGTREDFDQQGPASFFASRDGFVYLYLTNGRHWCALKRLLGDPAWLDDYDDDWLEFGVTPDGVARFRRGFAAWMAQRDKAPTSVRAQQLGVPLVPVNGVADLLASPQYRHRGFFATVDHPALGQVAYPTVPYRLSASPAQLHSLAPELGAHTCGFAPRRRPTVLAPQLKPTPAPRGGPLQGVRVVELTKVWAGPYAGKLLAFLGAEVIKVESADHPDEMRAYGGTDIDHAPYFLSINPEILSVDLDIKSPGDMARLRDLIAASDVVVNNLRPGAMERQGLGYEDLRALKDDVISVSIKMWGNDGPLGYQTGYAPCFAALAGMSALVGMPGGPPLGASMRYGDSTVGAATAYATVAALLHRELTGEGQFVDVSAVETLSSMIGDSLLAGEPFGPDGNRHADLSPHGCYPCRDGGWLALAVAADDEWSRVRTVLGLAADPRFADAAGRQKHVDALDAALAPVTADWDADELARRLQAVGVAANRSATAADVIADPVLWERDMYCFVSDHREGQRPVLGAPWRLLRQPARIERGAPLLGEHDAYVQSLLGAR